MTGAYGVYPGSVRVAVSTGGGDAPGLNAVIRAVVLGGLNRGSAGSLEKPGLFPSTERACAA